MVTFRDYADILFMVPLLIVGLGSVLFSFSWIVFKVSDYIESRKNVK
jgi:hypothetical protein